MITSRYFLESEFQRCSPACSLQDMKQSTMTKLDSARDIAGIPLVMTCAFRSSAWDRAKGRTGTGAHTTGYAVDIKCLSDATRWRVVNALIAVGFRRIGVAKTFIHADNSPNHAQEVVWLY